MKTDNKEKLSKIEISGRFLTKEIDGKSVVTLSEEVSASILNLSSQNSFNYCIYLVNNDRNENSNWEHLSFDIKPSMNLSNFIYKEVDCFQWFTQKNVYFLEVFLDESNERNKNNFWKVLEQCLCSVNKNIPIDRASLVISKTSQRYVKRIGEIKDLVVHVDTMVKQLEELNKKKLLEETITKEMQYLQITPPKLDEILNLEVAKKIYNTQGEIYNYDTNKDQLVNLNKDKKVMLTVYKLDSQRFDYVLCIETGNGLLLSIDRISEEINGQILDNQDSKFFCWITTKCYTNIVGDCLGFLFDKKEDSDQLRKILDKCNYEFKNKQAYETVDEENRKILENATDYSHIDCFSSDEEEDTKDKEEEEKKEEEKEKKRKKGKKIQKILKKIS